MLCPFLQDLAVHLSLFKINDNSLLVRLSSRSARVDRSSIVQSRLPLKQVRQVTLASVKLRWQLTYICFHSCYREDTPRPRPKGASLLLARELQHKRRQGTAVAGQCELYTDKDRAAAVTMGDKDIKQSLKVR